MNKVVCGMLCVLTLTACASKPTVTEFQCKAGDWETIGFRDGANGLQSTRLLDHQEACGEFSIVPDRNRYMTGWHTGMTEFCKPDNGFALGEQGKRIQPICQGKWRIPFAEAYDNGRKLYQARREVDSIRKRIQKNESRQAQIKQELIDLTAEQLDTSLTPDVRLHMMSQMEALTQERETLKHQIPILEEQLYDSEFRLEKLNQAF